MTDLHLHTEISHDSEESAENFILAAKAQNARMLGFAEHYDYDVFLENGAFEARLPDLSAYERRIFELSAKFPDFRILKGIELGYSAEAAGSYKELLQSKSFDYAILSVHTVKGRGDCYFPRFFDGLTKKQAYESYFNAVLESVRSDIDYQIIAHLGYVERYAPYADKKIVYGEFSCILDEILSEIIARGKCLEINTSARGTDGITIPNAEIIDRYISLGGKNFSLGSDAHSANRFSENFPAVKKFLLSRGVEYTLRFESGKPVKEKL